MSLDLADQYLAHAAELVARSMIDGDDGVLFRLIRYDEFDPHLTVEALVSMVAVLLCALASREDTEDLDALVDLVAVACPPEPVCPLLEPGAAGSDRAR